MTARRPQPEDIMRFKQASKASQAIPPTPKDDDSVFSDRHRQLGWNAIVGNAYSSWWYESVAERKQRLKRNRARMVRKAQK